MSGFVSLPANYFCVAQENAKIVPGNMNDLFATSTRRGLHANVVLISQFTIVIGITLTLIGAAHDAVAAPHLRQEFLIARVAVAGLGMILLATMMTGWAKPRIYRLSFYWMLLPQFMLAYMITMTGGAESSYKQGFIFTLIASTLFPILTFRQSLTIVGATFALLVSALAIGTRDGIGLGQVLAGSMHVLTVIIMCGIARIFLNKTFSELLLYEKEVSEKLKVVEKQLQDLAQLKALAVHQDKMISMGHVISGILHSINHPVNYALMAVDSSLRDVTVESRLGLKDSLIDVKRALTSINTIAASLRKFSAPKGSHLSHVAKNCSFDELVESAIQVMSGELENISVVKEVSPLQEIKCDQVAFLSVLTSILTNSVESLGRAKRMNSYIKIQASVTGETLVIEISDNGDGIPEETLTNIFDPFFTTDPSGKKLGLGLSIAYGEVSRHGGTLTAVSVVGEGTTMRIELPLAG